MEYSPTIAGQIQRIQDATDQLRAKGIDLELEVSKGVTLNSGHKLDDIADAFDSIVFSKGEVKNVELKVTQFNDSTIAGNTYELPTGFYKGLKIKPFFTQTSADEVLNIQTITNYTIESDSGEIKPTIKFNADGTINLEESYNYLESVSYTVKHSEIPTAFDGIGNGGASIKIEKPGWIPSGTYSFTGPYASVTLNNSNITSEETTIALSSTDTQTLIVESGIREKKIQINIPAATNAIDGDATANDIVASKTAWTATGRITGMVTDLRNTTTGAKDAWEDSTTGHLIIKPEPGCYNEDSLISTNITVGEATYTLTGNETIDEFEITPSSDEDEDETIYLTKVRIKNGAIYTALAAI